MSLNWVTKPPSALTLLEDERLLAEADGVQLKLQSYCPCLGHFWLTTRRLVFVQSHACPACRPANRKRQRSENPMMLNAQTEACMPLPLMHLTVPLEKMTNLAQPPPSLLSKLRRMAKSKASRKETIMTMRVQPLCGSKLEDAASGNALHCILQGSHLGNLSEAGSIFQQCRFMQGHATARAALQRQQSLFSRQATLNDMTRTVTAEETAHVDPVPRYEQQTLPIYAGAR